ncbi:MAG: 2-phospho-L-lactate transferase [Rhodospirillaceae bacterium]|nr:2-phospho-L-lactate transferase [Rhodospirillaceae bacterium]
MILALAGGVGGAKLAQGLAMVLPSEKLTVVVNTGDDFEHLGLSISPDLDTVLYTLAGLNDTARGWGLAGETWAFMDAMERLGGETWFRLGDKDLATHVERTRRLKTESLSTVIDDFRKRLGIGCRIAPMSDDPVRTVVQTQQGRLPFQDYFVRLQCAPEVRGFEFSGIASAKPSAGFIAALDAPDLEAVIICPSNPFVSVSPILGLPGVKERLAKRKVPIVAVSPIIGGEAVKGPAAKMFKELGLAVTQESVAGFYGDLLDGFVIDERDANSAARITGPRVKVAQTLMRDTEAKAALARQVLDFSGTLRS